MSEEYSGKEGRFVPLSLSKKWVANFRESNPEHTHAFYFGCELFENLLNEPGCVGIRINYAQDDDGSPKMVLIGVDKNGNNILKKNIKPPTELRLSSDGKTGKGPLRSDYKTTGYRSMGGDGSGEDDDEDSGMVDGGLPCPPNCSGLGFP